MQERFIKYFVNFRKLFLGKSSNKYVVSGACVKEIIMYLNKINDQLIFK